MDTGPSYASGYEFHRENRYHKKFRCYSTAGALRRAGWCRGTASPEGNRRRVGHGYDSKPVAEVSSSHEITWSDSANGSASFNSQAVAVGIRGTAGVVGISGAVGILDRVR